jgi:hypothetical protein
MEIAIPIGSKNPLTRRVRITAKIRITSLQIALP